jgi:hypothetical protein
MPARSERIYLFANRKGDPCQVMPFPYWWDRALFMDRYRQREIECSNPFDLNFAWLLDAGQAMAWNDECVRRFAQDARQNEPGTLEDQRRLTDALRQCRWLIVESCEWESGDC